MTKVQIFSSDERLVGFRVSGHSGYAEAGSDIVCAAISSAVQMTVNGITECAGIKAELDEGEANISFRVRDDRKGIAGLFLQSFQMQMELLSEQYSNYVKVEISEV